MSRADSVPNSFGPDASVSPVPPFLVGGGEMGELMRAKDWSQTPLGPPERWPQSLKTAVRIMFTSRQAIWIGWGQELIYLYNDPYQAIIGGRHPWALGQPARVVWHEIWDVIGPMLATAMSGDEGTYVESQLLIMERNGYREETYYTFSYSPIPDDDGSPGGIICANTDDTRRVIGERQLALLRELAAATAGAHTPAGAAAGARAAIATNSRDIPFALIFTDPEHTGRLELAETCGIDAKHPAAQAGAWPLEAVAAGREMLVVENLSARFGAPLPGGAWSEPPTRAVLVPLSASAGAIDGVLVVALNPFRLFDEGYRNFLGLVGGQIASGLAGAQAYAAEKQRAEQLAELDRAKTEFFSNVSHEFRTPLTLMLGPVEELLTREDAGVSPAAREQLAAVHRNSLRLLRLVNTMLDFSRIEAGRTEARFEPVDLAAYTAELASVFRAAVEKAGLQLIVDCPPLAEPVTVDRDMWEKIVLNLLSNAFKFTLAGQIEVRLAATQEGVQLTVRDTGVGIPPEELPRIFDRFHRVKESRGRTHEGTGIGLALVQELVRLQGGTIRAESVRDQGSRFIVTLPRRQAHPVATGATLRPLADRHRTAAFALEAGRWSPEKADRSAVQETPPAPASVTPPTAASQERPRIVWADDNADMRDYVRRLLAERFDVLAVGDGEAALAAVRAHRPDLVLSDVMMPKLDGYGLLRALRADPELATIPVILLSARAGEEARVGGVEAGADDYLVKPFGARELLARVEAHVRMAQFRREASAAVAASEERYRSIVSIVTDVPWVTDASGGFVREQPAWQAYTGQSWAEYRGFGWAQALHPDDRPRMLEEWTRGRERPAPFSSQGRFWHAGSKDWRHFLVKAAPIFNPDGSVREWVGSCTDIESQIRAEENLKRARDNAIAANRAKDEFLATLSHELRTPLNPVLLIASEALNNNALTPEVRGDFKVIADNVSLQARLIDDLLDLNRVTRGKLALDQQSLDVHGVVRDAAATIDDEVRAKRIALEFHLAATAPGVRGDPVRLCQVFWNVLKNAVKFTPAGGRIRVTSANVPGSREIELRFEDSGIGMSAEEMARIFQPFVQGRHAEREGNGGYGGLGLGLAISRMLVELHGGTIAAESRGLDQGSTVRVRLPLEGAKSADAAPAVNGTAAAAGSASAPPARLAAQRILFVEDHEPTRVALAGLLRRRGYDVTAVGSIGEALQRARHATFDLLVSDLGLPDGDGCRLMTELRHTHQALPGIAISGYGMQEDLVRSRDAGFGEHLTKPVSIESLERALGRLLRKE